MISILRCSFRVLYLNQLTAVPPSEKLLGVLNCQTYSDMLTAQVIFSAGRDRGILLGAGSGETRPV